jgi:hypothetical protein
MAGRSPGSWIPVLTIALACCWTGVSGAAQFQEIDLGVFPSAAGAAWGDYDNDGYPDLFLAGGTTGTAVPVPHGPLLFRNHRDLTFTDVSQSVGLPTPPLPEWGVAWGDYDSDGNLDVLVGASDYPDLYRWSGTQFTEVGADAGFHVTFSSSYSQSWCDYNADNSLDAFCSNIFGPGYLMRNNGDGTFTEMSAAAGMTGDALNEQAMAAAWADCNNDGRPDLALARQSKPAKLYLNNGDGTFTDVSETSGLFLIGDSQSAIWGDYDNDGWFDLYLTAGPYLDGSGGRHWLLHNNHDGTFTDATAAAGLSLSPTVGGGAVWLDYDNDGFLDLYVGNWGVDPHLYYNNGNGTFTNAVIGSGLEVGQGFQSGAAAAADIDLDGRVDLLQATFATEPNNNRCRLYHNVGFAGNWLRVRALTSSTGDATDATGPTRDAIGARVDLNCDNDATFPVSGARTLTRLIDGGGSWLGQNEQIAHFGLGASALVAVRVRFPDGSVVVHRSVAANQQLVIRDVPADREEIFDDVPLDYWAYLAIAATLDAGIVQGYWDDTYRPAGQVDRASMAVYLARALAGGDEAVPDPSGDTPSFTDVGTDHWAYKYIEYAASPEANVVQGYPGGNYKPDDLVSRGQMAVYIARAMVTPSGDAGVPDPPAEDPTFSDVTATGNWSWCYKHVEYLAAADIVQGYPDGTYHPATIVTRDQMAVYVARSFELSRFLCCR